jgi:hypothetical protein
MSTVIVLMPIFLLAAVIGTFYFGMRYVFLARLIQDTPTSSIRSANQGYVELSGVGELLPGEPILTPHSKQLCLWFRYSTAAPGEWSPNNDMRSGGLFLLNDGTGSCLIDPDFAQVIGGPKKKSKHYQLDGSIEYHTEEYLPVGVTLYVIGTLATDVDGFYLDIEGRADDLLVSWKQDYANFLEQFDKDNDGHISLEEWGEARKAAKEKIIKAQLAGNTPFKYPTLSHAKDKKRPYLISMIPQEQLIKRYHFMGHTLLGGFVVSCVLSVMWLCAHF